MRDEFSVTLDERDIAEAYRPRPRPRRLARLALLLALMLVLLIAGLVIRFPEARATFADSPLVIGLTGAVVVLGTLVIALLIAAPALRRRIARSTLDDHPGMREPAHYACDPEQFAVRTTYSQAAYPWEQLWDWHETDRVLIVMPTPRNFYVIPKRDIDPGLLERLRDNLMRARKRASRS